MQVRIDDALESRLNALAKLVDLPVEGLVNRIIENELDNRSNSISACYGRIQAGRAVSSRDEVGNQHQGRRGELADRIRRHVVDEFIAPAKHKGKSDVSVRAGDVHRDLGLRNRLPAVCAALGSSIFLKVAGVQLANVSGPANGASTVYVFKV